MSSHTSDRHQLQHVQLDSDIPSGTNDAVEDSQAAQGALGTTNLVSNPAPRKKARTARRSNTSGVSKRSRVRMGGFGSKVADVPIDVLYEILSYVEPMDILNMSRTNKGLRGALTSKSARFVWRNTIENVEMPECPEDLNEMQYTVFVLDPYCDFCGRVGSKRDQYQHLFLSREKVCADCALSRFQYCNEKYRSRVPTFKLWKRTKYGDPEEIFGNQKRSKIGTISPKTFKTPIPAPGMSGRSLKIRSRHGSRMWRMQKLLKGTEPVRLDWTRWANEVATLEEGLVMPMSKLRRIKTVTSTTALTQRAWEKMKPDLITLMKEVKTAQEAHDRELEERRLAEEEAEAEERLAKLRDEQSQMRVPMFIKAFLDYQCGRPYDPYGPRAVDLAQLPEVQALIFKALGERVDQQAFSTLLEASFDELSSKWRTSIESAFLEVMKRTMPEATKQDMWDPAAIFLCRACCKLLPTSSALAHSICEQREKSIFWACFPDAPWRGSNLVFKHEAFVKAKAALNRIQPSKRIESLHVDLYECTECSQDMGRRVLRSWFEAISSVNSCLLAKGHSLQRVSLTEEEKSHMDIYLSVKFSTSKVGIVCSTCRTVCYINNWRTTGFSKHQAECHGNTATTWREGVDFYRTPDSVPVLTLGKDYILDTTMDVHAVVFKVLTAYFQTGYDSERLAPDLRIDEEYARRNYVCSRPPTVIGQLLSPTS